MLDLLVQRGTPFVLLDRAIDGVPADVVIGDNIGGERKLTGARPRAWVSLRQPRLPVLDDLER